MADGSGSASARTYGSTPSRRPSYASVASGATQTSVPLPGSGGAFVHMATTTPRGPHPPVYTSASQSTRRLSSNVQDTTVTRDTRKMQNLPDYSRKYAEIGKMGPNSFFMPSYLKNSRYASKLEAAHAAKLRALRERSSSSLATSGSVNNVQRLAPSHRGMTYDIIESNPPKDEDELSLLPSKWNNQDKYPGLEVTNEGLDVKYSGSAGKAETEAASVRADYPMSPQCGIYYYEVEIKQKSKDCAVAVGFATLKASLERLPGWEGDSWAYHGDDGRAFSGDHQGRNYGPTFAQNDVVGCGLNFHTGQAFFTRNGLDLGVAFRDLKNIRPFPAVGIKKYSGAIVSVNFGQKPFVYDIDNRVERERDQVRDKIMKQNTAFLHPQRDQHLFVQDLVAQFLSHGGYVETAQAFAQERQVEQTAIDETQTFLAHGNDHDNTGAVHRQRIRRAILDGDIDKALEVTNDRFPDVLRQSPEIVFHLKCRKWIELVSRASDLQKSNNAVQIRSSNNGTSSSAIVEDVFDQQMELDEEHHQSLSPGKSATTTPTPNINSDMIYNDLLAQTMSYGQTLQKDYRDDATGEYKKTLANIFSLVAYNEPRESVHGHLLDPSGRVKVAEELNSAILVSLGQSPSATIETAYRQTEALIEIMSQDGGPAAFVNLRNDFIS